jgi:DNA-binding NarL/FixJ family response regulator
MRWLDVVREDLSLDVRCSATVSGALDIVLTSDVDIAIVGATLDDGSYRDALRTLGLARRDLPVIVVAELGSVALRDAFALGAVDVVSPGDLARLAHAIERVLPPIAASTTAFATHFPRFHHG